ncbi:FAD-dependent oxidoreductase [Mycolicibacterium sp. ND9-15]|uniref:FAD-dependent oxidoreductase n=1 Tax=Mycolicibacterium sp. ND9-15 TaxID=3042320 RepID=UPI003FA373D4
MNMRPNIEYDVIVVGFGAAGAAAAIEAADRGARVLVLDRGYGGGATALSGGIIYAGAGTAEQRAGGTTTPSRTCGPTSSRRSATPSTPRPFSASARRART